MSFRAWLRRDRLLPRITFALRRFRRGVGATTRWWPLAVAVAVLVPYLATWCQAADGFSLSAWCKPVTLSVALASLAALAGLVAWFSWVGVERMGTWLAAWVVLFVAWGGTFFLWLFLENSAYRALCLATVAAASWWYLEAWRRRQQLVAVGGEALQGTPALVLGILAAFGLGVGTESLLVFFNLPLWQLVLAAYVPMVVSFLGLVVLSGWSLVQHGRYLLATALVLGEVFMLVTWWPTSAYVVGFTLAATYLALALTLRQEAQGFFNRRSYTRELGFLAFTFVAVLLTARWF